MAEEKKAKKWGPVQWAMTVLGVCVLIWGLFEGVMLFIDHTTNETSDDAQVEQYVTPINIRATGYIERICFREHQQVKKGDTLLVLDQREYRIQLAQAEANLKDALAGSVGVDATVNRTQTNSQVFDSSIAEIEVRLEKLQKDVERYSNLVARDAATPIQLEQIETEYKATLKRLEAARKQKATAVAGVSEASTKRANTEAAIQLAEAALEQAKLNLSYTVVVAPCDGQIGRRAIEEGQFIAAGTPITTVIPEREKWVIANFRETQTEHLSVGQEVSITIDAIKSREYRGHITSIAGATGAKFSAVPTDNSAGNFVKIQQRIPVRIDFDGLSQEDYNQMAAGMMAVVKVKVKSED